MISSDFDSDVYSSFKKNFEKEIRIFKPFNFEKEYPIILIISGYINGDGFFTVARNYFNIGATKLSSDLKAKLNKSFTISDLELALNEESLYHGDIRVWTSYINKASYKTLRKNQTSIDEVFESEFEMMYENKNVAFKNCSKMLVVSYIPEEDIVDGIVFLSNRMHIYYGEAYDEEYEYIYDRIKNIVKKYEDQFFGYSVNEVLNAIDNLLHLTYDTEYDCLEVIKEFIETIFLLTPTKKETMIKKMINSGYYYDGEGFLIDAESDIDLVAHKIVYELDKLNNKESA